MSEYNRKLADKFFNNQCSSKEAEKVLEWLDSSEGQDYLSEKMDDDLDSFDENSDADENDAEHLPNINKLDPGRHFSGILSTIEQLERSVQRKRDMFAPLLKIAAALLVVAAASVFVYTSGIFEYQEEQVSETVLTTTADQQREVTLVDGTIIHLNQHSAVTISEKYMQEKREVFLEGEAYFEVAHRADLPFIIRTAYSEVEVLGTSFNVKSNPEAGQIEVAVLEGSVSFRDSRESEATQVILQKGEYGFLDIASRQITTEDFGVENYLAWKNREFVFNELSLGRVCIQLNRFYDVTCEFEDETIENRRLTANFPNDDLENTLSVIAFTLYLEYESDGSKVSWLNAQ
ncbi:MAG: FecR domain-containing protein [Balneolaceae bacterium]|nr:FecR domain-containing protein [Balneolaceae bacterium]